MKILSCKLKYLSSVVQPLRITWKVQLSDDRVIKVIDYRDMDDFRTKWTAESLEWGDEQLAEDLYEFTDRDDYSNYEI